ncbi:hypothetical protein LINPERPRIM_LOCUS3198 [Linum perenne]
MSDVKRFRQNDDGRIYGRLQRKITATAEEEVGSSFAVAINRCFGIRISALPINTSTKKRFTYQNPNSDENWRWILQERDYASVRDHDPSNNIVRSNSSKNNSRVMEMVATATARGRRAVSAFRSAVAARAAAVGTGVRGVRRRAAATVGRVAGGVVQIAVRTVMVTAGLVMIAAGVVMLAVELVMGVAEVVQVVVGAVGILYYLFFLLKNGSIV